MTELKSVPNNPEQPDRDQSAEVNAAWNQPLNNPGTTMGSRAKFLGTHEELDALVAKNTQSGGATLGLAGTIKDFIVNLGVTPEQRKFDAIIFDMDGVVTSTAEIHFTAWKETFDQFLSEREEDFEESHSRFTMNDYLEHVDGIPRIDGVRAFLDLHGIKLSEDEVQQIAKKKNDRYLELLETEEIKTFQSTIELMRAAKEQGLRIGIGSSSKNARLLLEKAGIADLPEVVIDGVYLEENEIDGKPAPYIFQEGAKALGVSCSRAVVVEDAVKGVQAGKSGNFGLVVGIARKENSRELKRAGADIVVEDMDTCQLDRIDQWFNTELAKEGWRLQYNDFKKPSGAMTDKEVEQVRKEARKRQALLSVGNGYMCSRGANEEPSVNNDISYPGTYIAGVYNEIPSEVSGREIYNEDLVNCPNWHAITFKVDDGEWFEPHESDVVSSQRELDMQSGILKRHLIVRDDEGRETLITSERCISMADCHLAAQQYSVTPLNYSGEITVTFGLHGDHINGGVDRYSKLNQQHLQQDREEAEGAESRLVVATTASRIQIATAARASITLNGERLDPDLHNEIAPQRIDTTFKQLLETGDELKIEKIVGIHTSKDSDLTVDPIVAATQTIAKYGSYEEVAGDSAASWKEIWKAVDIELEGDRFAQQALRLHRYHTLLSASPHNLGIDASLGARGLTGEAYRGHVFWDEMFIFPLIVAQQPKVARSLLQYRYNRIDAAKEYAAEHGYQGAMFPWQSGSDGREQTQVIHYNPLSGDWGPDHSSKQRHVSLAIQQNVWQYYTQTGDLGYMQDCGAEMFFEICRFWASAAKEDQSTGRYDIDRVMGPDEFHEKYPDAGPDEGGLRNNAYTNIMVSWFMDRAQELYGDLGDETRQRLQDEIGLNELEVRGWQKIGRNLNLEFSDDGILAQFAGFSDLKALPAEIMHQAHGRVDRVLKAQGLSPDEYQVAKQADLLMAPYVLGEAQVRSQVEKMGYRLPEDWLNKHFDFYLDRTSHGSTLSRLVHGALAREVAKNDPEGHRHDTLATGDRLSHEALASDIEDIQGGTTGEGIHLGVMSGTVWQAMHSAGGLDLSTDKVKIDPFLPPHWDSLAFSFKYRGDDYHCLVKPDSVTICANSGSNKDMVEIEIQGRPESLRFGVAQSFAIEKERALAVRVDRKDAANA